ncbi:FkbM family methyltransferase [Flavobacteriaceae bacterium S0825]|uniref:FkbM family methyltransferase n=1 Tax=Gaetbulibacter sp. S0825 TaxID=2720084 RepID=UPI00142FDCEB|nr:FkbM family methyltransferase [Gaetbulibacter sp. S0825]MCK0109015.1 FkbM family methyltransferase [Flavobacteriaceae bacterium S0825]NIX64650.1 FkbM family methyltransferase [Gaetbulibacter sp. S0825]
MKIKLLKKAINSILRKFGFTIVNVNRFEVQDATPKTFFEKANLLDGFYNFLKNQQYEPITIYDIGANKGSWTAGCLEFFPDTTYYLFEPQINLKKDIDTLFLNKKNIQLFSVGVGNANGELLFTIRERDDSCTFILSESEAKQQGLKQIKVPIVQLDSFVVENKLMPPSILKIDAEGFDIEVLQGAKKLMQNAEIIMIEVGVVNKIFKNSALNVMKYLDEAGFRFFDITDLNRPFENKALWLCEFVFIKKNGVLDKDYLNK